MTTDDRIRNVKLQYDINREAAKISALSSGKIEKFYRWRNYSYYSCQSRIIEKSRFTYSPLGKSFEKQAKTLQEQGENK